MAIDFYRDLGSQVDYELEACIGCHLCMRACPLPDSKLIQMGELNDATAGGPMGDRLLRFTLDCTQCGACVPVCPANLSRMRMMLAAKLRVEVPPATTPVYLQADGQPIASGWTVGTLAAQLAQYPLLADVGEATLRAFIPHVGLRRYASGTTIIREGAYSNSLYLIVTGAVQESIVTADGRLQPLVVLPPGYFFGELGILSDRPNAATATAAADTYLLEISDAALRRLMTEAAAFRERLTSLHAQRALGAQLRRTALFRDLGDEALLWLIERATLRTCERGEIIAEEGETATHLTLVLNGFVKVCRRGSDGGSRVITYLRDGGYFGDWALMQGGPQAVTLIANTRCEIVEVPKDDVEALLASYPALRDAFTLVARQDYDRTARALQPAPLPGAGVLATLLDEGVLQSHSLLVIDERLCVDCNNCVDACVRRHGHPRVERRGLTVGPYLIATACRHCDDPLCLLCPVDGIVHAPDGQIMITDNCIGCGACAARCPYDNIRMADKSRMTEIASERGRFGGIWDLLRNFAQPRESGAITFDRDDLRPKVAVKCDLCVGYGDGPACVRNCPTGAAFRVDGAAFFGDGAAVLATPTVARPRRR